MLIENGNQTNRVLDTRASAAAKQQPIGRASRRVLLPALILVIAPHAWAQNGVAMEEFTQQYCMDCHNADDWAGSLAFDMIPLNEMHSNRDVWEMVLLKLRVGMMPPAIAEAELPMEERQAVISYLEEGLDRILEQQGPDPGPSFIRRLNRSEYQNAVRDLLDLEVDAAALLPPDDSAYGFDNNAQSLGVTPVLVEQYLSAAGKIASLAVGDMRVGPSAQTLRIRQDASQNTPILGMPLGTVGGGTMRTTAPLDGEYRLDIKLYKSNLGSMKGLELPHQLEITVDGERVHLVTVGGEEDFKALMHNITEAAEMIEARSSVDVYLPAGPHEVSVGFLYQGAIQNSQRLQPFLRSSQDLLDITGHPHVESITITGPYNPAGPGDTPSRQRIFSCVPDARTAVPDAAELACARAIVERLARRAYRGTETSADIETLMYFFMLGRQRDNFDTGVQAAVERLLASPKFLFRMETDPEDVAPGTVYAVSDHELASRLSFFLWSSIPDETLLNLADSGQLGLPGVLEQQIERMLSDPKARALVDNFAGQWLYLRNLRSMIPNSSGFPDFDDNLRQALLTETELFFESIVQEDRSVLDLMTADYTFLNERLARHYGIKEVYGNHFRKVQLNDETQKGILGKGSVLMISSHTDRTSPIVRGQWVLTNILGAPPPAPPPDIPPLPEASESDGPMLTLRQRMETHRNSPACASCHEMMDPIGYSLENFDAVGAWREYEMGVDSPRIDASGRLVDGSDIIGPVELRNALMKQPEIFVSTLVEKLMIYALGRGLVPADMPTLRQIVRDSREQDYRFSALIEGIVGSTPFRMRTSTTDVSEVIESGNQAAAL